MGRREYSAAVIGVSAGGHAALTELFSHLQGNLCLPVLVVQHLHPDQDGVMSDAVDHARSLTFKDAEDKEPARPGFVYFAPPNYHLMVERGGTLALSVEEKVNWARPSIDVLFESAVFAWAPALLGIILTGANSDGARGMELIKKHGGLTIAEDPQKAEYPAMPQAAIDTGSVDVVLPLEKIGELLRELGMKEPRDE